MNLSVRSHSWRMLSLALSLLATSVLSCSVRNAATRIQILAVQNHYLVHSLCDPKPEKAVVDLGNKKQQEVYLKCSPKY